MNRSTLIALPLLLSCFVPACTHDYDQFDANGSTGGAGATAGTGGTGGSTGGTGGSTGGTGGSTGGTGGSAGTGGDGGVGGTAGAAGTGGAAGSAGTGGLDGGLDAPDDVATDAPDDVVTDGGVPCTEPGAVTWSQNGHCYFVIQGQPRSWQTQRDACVAAGAHLATITSQGENDFVAPLVGGTDRWIGLYRPTGGDPFGWVTGEALSYENWANNEPNEPGESCGRIRTTSTWADRACDNSYGAICERE